MNPSTETWLMNDKKLRPRSVLALASLMLVLPALACVGPLTPDADIEQPGADLQENAVLIDFELYPDATVPCGGAGRCPLSTEYADVGVTFWSENGHPNCGPDRVWFTHPTGVYDAPGSPRNRAAWNDCSVGSFWVDLAAVPDTVDFEIWMNDETDVQIQAYAEGGARLPAGAVAREPYRYTTSAGFVFRRERVRISTTEGIERFGWETRYFGVFLDDLRFNR